MGDTELTVTAVDVAASYDHEGTIEHVDLDLTYELAYETMTGKRRVSYGAPRFRFDVDTEGTARLSSFDSDEHDRNGDDTVGVPISELRGLPAASEILLGIGDVETVEPVADSIADLTGDIDTVEYDTE